MNRSTTGLLFLVASLGACTAPGGPSSATDWDWSTKTKPDGGTGAGGTGGGGPVVSALCVPARASQPLPPRAEVVSAEVMVAAPTMYTEDLFNIFKANCGACHVSAGLGEFRVTAATFPQLVDQKVLDIIRSTDAEKFMPPPSANGIPYAQRLPGDPVVLLASLLDQWIAQGRPDSLFYLQAPMSEEPGQSSYLLSPEVGMRMTNIGDCVPEKGMVGTSLSRMDEIDAFFTAATSLPDTLSETDLTTLDTSELAENGVIAYAPAYPLWSDDAGKIRHIRVPRGQSVKFNKQTQTFDIPPNTRFYKTFLKEVIDRDGNQTFRKIETRLIVSRPDTKRPDGSTQNNALFGTYLWNPEETTATLHTLPLQDGTPFTDRVLTYSVDEPREQMLLDSNPRNLKYAIDNADPPLRRHYAVPGSQRCIQCHMGSPTSDFILGFFPLQVARRADDTGGVFEPSGADEMSQLQRFIDYGVITGMASAADVTPLEGSQGDRKPRNDYELKAQGYLLGNCAHCHNPRGFPSIKNPELTEALNFLPSVTPAGGIFQFPLERMSPLRKRGINQDVDIPYITPSLREYPVPPSADGSSATWGQKWVASCASSATDPYTHSVCGDRTTGPAAHVSVPWRSLVYRNVDTPFMYADDFAIFPHMPMNTPGFDCRAPRIMGDWMVSIPALRKHPELDEDAVRENGGQVDTEPQPYVEIKPDDPRYSTAMFATKFRMDAYRNGSRYNFCPDTLDLLDQRVVRAGGNDPIVPPSSAVVDPEGKVLQIDLGVPTHAHWVVTDLTEPKGDWNPRRGDWGDKLLQDKVDTVNLPTAPDLRAIELRHRKDLLEILKVAKLSDVRDFALTEIPYGLWQQKPGVCDKALAAEAKLGDFTGERRRMWMDREPTQAPSPSSPVFMQSPGAAIYGNICFNCHGPDADSKGLLADAINTMTGGTARVANFRGGLFGPIDVPGQNRSRIFGAGATMLKVTPEELGSRYMAWMALGGTDKKLPPALLNLVATTPVMGVRRDRLNVVGSPNMLKLAQDLCRQALLADALSTAFSFSSFPVEWSKVSGLVDANADAEMWLKLCGIGNRMVVHVPRPVGEWTDTGLTLKFFTFESLYWADAYPATDDVMDHRGRKTKGVSRDNLFPVCIRRPTDAAQRAAADAYLASHQVGPGKNNPDGSGIIPYCPPALFEPDPETGDPKWRLVYTGDGAQEAFEFVDADKWALRGGVNAGYTVYSYLESLERGVVKPKPTFNHCEQLPKPGP